MRKNVVILTGAGISAESGLKTFRGEGGLWEGVPISEVATPEAWERDFKTVLRFYDERRKSVLQAVPNEGHRALVRLEERFNVQIITQNIDDLHERAGSKNVLHLHGEITKARSSEDPNLIYSIEGDCIPVGKRCEHGSQLRPHIVWFGEPVPLMDAAVTFTNSADVFLVIGTSLEVYPAASLIDFVKPEARTILIDPRPPKLRSHGAEVVAESATVGLPKVVAALLESAPPP